MSAASVCALPATGAAIIVGVGGIGFFLVKRIAEFGKLGGGCHQVSKGSCCLDFPLLHVNDLVTVLDRAYPVCYYESRSFGPTLMDVVFNALPHLFFGRAV